MSDGDILEDEPGPAPVLDRASVERTSGRRGEDITNADQISLLNSSIEIALKRQSDNVMQYLDSRISKISKPTTTNSEDFTFKGEGNKVQFKFNSERSSKLSEILECLLSRNYDSAEDIIKSEISQIGQRNKIIKMLTVMDGMSLRSTSFILLLMTMMTQLNFEPLSTEQTGDVLNRMIEVSNQTLLIKAVEAFFVANIDQQCQKLAHNSRHFNLDPALSATSRDILPDCPYKNRQFVPRKPPSTTITASGVDVSQSTQ